MNSTIKNTILTAIMLLAAAMPTIGSAQDSGGKSGKGSEFIIGVTAGFSSTAADAATQSLRDSGINGTIGFVSGDDMFSDSSLGITNMDDSGFTTLGGLVEYRWNVGQEGGLFLGVRGEYNLEGAETSAIIDGDNNDTISNSVDSNTTTEIDSILDVMFTIGWNRAGVRPVGMIGLSQMNGEVMHTVLGVPATPGRLSQHDLSLTGIKIGAGVEWQIGGNSLLQIMGTYASYGEEETVDKSIIFSGASFENIYNTGFDGSQYGIRASWAWRFGIDGP